MKRTIVRKVDTTGHGPSNREQQILDRHDAGMPVRQIAGELGLGRNYVEQVTQRLSGSWVENRRFETMVREGPRRLAEAVEATGMRFS